MSTETRAGVITAATACALCCALPILVGLGVLTGAGAALFQNLLLAVAAALLAAAWWWRRRTAQTDCGSDDCSC